MDLTDLDQILINSTAAKKDSNTWIVKIDWNKLSFV